MAWMDALATPAATLTARSRPVLCAGARVSDHAVVLVLMISLAMETPRAASTARSTTIHRRFAVTRRPSAT